MKLAEIKKQVMADKCVVIAVDQDNRRWLGNGKYFYAVDDGIMLDEENVLAVLDVDKDKREKIDKRFWECADVRMTIMPDDDHDIRLYPNMSVYYGDELITLMTSEDGELFGIRQSAIKPANAKFGLAFYLRRKAQSTPWIACEEDMFVTALLLPEPTRVIEQIVDTLAKLKEFKLVNYEAAVVCEAQADEDDLT